MRNDLVVLVVLALLLFLGATGNVQANGICDPITNEGPCPVVTVPEPGTLLLLAGGLLGMALASKRKHR